MNNFCQPASIQSDKQRLYSERFEDIYFSSDGGKEETEHVFLGHNNLPERWQDESLTDFVIAETGFGSGLNFFVTLLHWKMRAATGAHLHYYSSEKYPLSQTDFIKVGEQICRRWPELAPFFEALATAYPPRVCGYHSVKLDSFNVTLTLMLGDNQTVYSQLALGKLKVDAWYLDGFAPGKNPDMWQTGLFQQMRRLSKTGTTFSTFTAVGQIKRSLQAHGFIVDKVKGFGRKRDMLRGRFNDENNQEATALDKKATPISPWFALPTRAKTQTHSGQDAITIIGAGLAGSAVARLLADKGYEVTVLDKSSLAASGASSNLAGVVYPPISQQASVEAQYYLHAYLRTLKQLTPIKQQEPAFPWFQTGVLQVAHDTKIKSRFEKFIAQGVDESVVHAVSAQQASIIAGTDVKEGGLFFPTGGFVSPPTLCRYYLTHDNIHCHFDTEVTALTHLPQGWQLSCRTQDGSLHTRQSQQVILANAIDAAQLLAPLGLDAEDDFTLSSNRGQVSYLPDKTQPDPLKTVLCYKGYATPAIDKQWVVGATADNEKSSDSCPEHDRKNIEQLNTVLKKPIEAKSVKGVKSNTGFRTSTRDHLPLVGPVPDKTYYQQHYADLHKGKACEDYPTARYLPGLYLSIAHRARGISSSWLAAQLLAAQITEEPLPVATTLYEGVHPARFMVKQLKRQGGN